MRVVGRESEIRRECFDHAAVRLVRDEVRPAFTGGRVLVQELPDERSDPAPYEIAYGGAVHREVVQAPGRRLR